MKSVLMAAALVVLTVASGVAQAEDHKDIVAPAPTASPAEAAASAAAEKAEDGVADVKETTLKDGTKVVIEGETVSVIGKDGAKTPAPDGEHELADGTKVTTKDGKVVKPEGEKADEHKAH